MKIWCPRCDYEPRASDRWQCRPGCFHVWNTFETHALCPGCFKQWAVTWCPRCSAVSPHEDWYHEEIPDEAVAEAIEELVGVG